jgi:ribonuclease P protein component
MIRETTGAQRDADSAARCAGDTNGGFHFPKARRLLTPAQYRAAFDCGRSGADGYVLLFVGANELSVARLGLAVSKRVARRAVVRNRIKRVIRESFRQRHAGLVGKDIVIVAKPGSATATTAELRQSLDRMLGHAAKQPAGKPRTR